MKLQNFKIRIFLLLILIFCLSFFTYSQESPKKISSQRKVGLVLSGGGAKGFAHIGVLRELGKNNIKLDYIAGTSMGAVIAALYSIGYTPDEIEQILLDLDIGGILAGDKKDIADRPLEERINNSSAITALRYNNEFKFSLPKSLDTSHVTNYAYLTLKKILWRVEGIENFDDFQIPLRVIATNLDDGKAVAFKSGDLARALTASMAIPTIMDPIRIGEDRYVDGMVARNFPVQDLKDMGAEIIIGSDVGVQQEEVEDYNFISVFGRILAIYSYANNGKQKELTTVLVSPKVGNISPTNFSDMKSIVKIGEDATNSKMAEIKRVVPMNNQQKNLSNEKLEKERPAEKFQVNNIVLENSQNLEISGIKKSVMEFFEYYKGKKISEKEFESRIKFIDSQNYINKIYYKIDKSSGTITLDIDENPQNTINVLANYRTDYGTVFKLSTNISSVGSIGTFTNIYGKFGDYLGAGITNFTYYGNATKVGFFGSAIYDESPFFINNKASRHAKYINKESSLKAGAIGQIANRFLFGGGLSINSSFLSLDTGSIEGELNTKSDYVDFFGQVGYDSLNDVYFPKKGMKLELNYNIGGYTKENLRKANYSGTVYRFFYNVPFTKRLTFSAGISGGLIEGADILETKYYKVGGAYTNISKGELSFAGYTVQNKIVDKAFIGNLGFRFQTFGNLYAALQFDLGTFNQVDIGGYQAKLSVWNQFVSGGRAGLSYDSYIGPISFDISYNDDIKQVVTQFNVGYYLN
ncbi:MAG: patatin-like phospholipase family protein [Fusobacteriaceae bacterium]